MKAGPTSSASPRGRSAAAVAMLLITVFTLLHPARSNVLETVKCEYENDGVCDVPVFCSAGTDCNDCRTHAPGSAAANHRNCIAVTTMAPTPAPKLFSSTTGFGFLVPFHNDLTYHGRSARINLDDFSTVDVLDFQPAAKDAAGWPTECLDAFGLRLVDQKQVGGTTYGSASCGLAGFVGGFTDMFGFAYFVPNRNGPLRSGKLARVNMTQFSTVEYVDVAKRDPDLAGFVGGYAAGQWGYLLPRYNGNGFSGKVARVALRDPGPFSSARVETLNLQIKDASLKGFYGGFTTGSHGYLTPFNDEVGQFGTSRATKLVRFNLGEFRPSAVEILDLNQTRFSTNEHGAADLGGFQGSFTIDEFAYLVPSDNGAPFGKLTRVNVLEFNAPTNMTVQTIDLQRFNPALTGFNGGFKYQRRFDCNASCPSDGAYLYLVPYKNNFGNRGDFHGNLVRVKVSQFEQLWLEQKNSSILTNESGIAASAIDVLDLRQIDDELRGFCGGFSHNGYGYLVPYYKGAYSAVEGVTAAPYAGKLVRFDLLNFDGVRRNETGAIDVLNLEELSGVGSNILKGFRFGFQGLGSVGNSGTLPPQRVVYSEDPALYTVGFEIRNNAPTYSGGLATRAVIHPRLPAGLSFDEYSGVITGTPTVMDARKDYIITISNDAGSVNHTLSIKVGQGNFAYLVPNVNGKVTRLNLNDFRTVESRDLEEVEQDLTGFSKGFALKGWAYFVPDIDGTTLKSKVVRMRLDDFQTTQTLDLNQHPASRGEYHGYRDGFHISTSGEDWGYLVPRNSTRLIRFGLEDFKSIQEIDLAAETGDPNLRGFSAGFNFLSFIFLVPEYSDEYHGKMVRLQLDVKYWDMRAKSVEVRDLRMHDGDLKGFAGGSFVGAYAFLVPYYNGVKFFGKVVRVNLGAANFDSAKVDVLNCEKIDPQLVGFKGGFALGDVKFYLVPYEHAKVVEFDVIQFHNAPEIVKTLDLQQYDPGLKGFISGFVVGAYGYLVPRYDGKNYFGKIVQLRLQDFSVYRFLDLTDTDTDLRGFMNGFYYMRVSEAHNYTENGEGISICRGIGLVDLDTSIVTRATITIDPSSMTGDVLELPNAKLLSGQPGDDVVDWLPDANGIQGQYLAKFSRLTLSGGATLQKYEATLRSILFWSTSEDPAEVLRTVEFNVQGQLVYKVSVKLTKVNDFVTVENLPSKIMYVQGAPAMGIASSLVIMDLELLLNQQAEALQKQANDANSNEQMELFEMMMMMMMMMAGEIKFNLISAKIFIIENFDPNTDLLMLNPYHPYLAENNVTDWSQLGINVTYNDSTGVLLLVGEASIQHYQSALRAIQYQSNSEDESTRVIAFTINDGTTEQRVATMAIAAVSRNVQITYEFVQGSSSISHEDDEITNNGPQFVVKLSEPPKAPILLAITSSDSTEGVCDPTFAVVSKDNYRQGVLVTVTGQPDNLDDGDVNYVATVVPITTKDRDYLRHPPVDVPLVNQDDPINKVRITAAPIYCTTSEQGDSCQFTLTAPMWHESFMGIKVKMVTDNPDEGMLLLGDGTKATQAEILLEESNRVDGVVARVQGVNDDFDDEDVNYMIQLSAQLQLKDQVALKTISPEKMTSNIVCKNIDDDTAGISAEPCASRTTSEAGERCAITITFSARPLAAVRFQAWTDDTSEGDVVNPQVTVQPADWTIPVQIIVQGIDDATFDNDVNYTAYIRSSSDDLSYNQRVGQELSFRLTNLDNDEANLAIKQYGQKLSGTGLPVDETGASQSITVQLPDIPLRPVTIEISVEKPEEASISLDGLPHPTQSTVTITIDATNWMTPQEVLITGKDDSKADGDQGFQVQFKTSSEQPKFNNILWYFYMYNIDDDSLVFSKRECIVEENGKQCDLALSLPNWRPEGFISIIWHARNQNPDVVKMTTTDTQVHCLDEGDECRFTWTNATHFEERKVTFSAVDNNVDADDAPWVVTFDGRITFDHHRNTPLCAGKEMSDPCVGRASIGLIDANSADVLKFQGSSVDDDTAGMIISEQSGFTCEENGTTVQTFTVKLTSEPVHEVHVPIKSSDSSEGVTCTQRRDCPKHFPDRTPLRFTAANWALEQVVEVRGTQDDTFDGTQPFDQKIGPSESDDARYDQKFEGLKSFECLDDDVVGLNVTVLKRTSSEAGRRAEIVAALTSAPKAPILFSISSLDASEGVPDPAIFVLSQQNWKTGEIIQSVGQGDDIDDGDIDYTVAVTPITTEDPDYLSVNAEYVELTNLDDPVNNLHIELSATNCTTTEKAVANGGSECRINMKLSSWHVGEGKFESLTVVLTIPTTQLAPLAIQPRKEGKLVNLQEDSASDTLSHIFTASNWAEGWEFGIRGEDDDAKDGNQDYIIEVSATIKTLDIDGNLLPDKTIDRQKKMDNQGRVEVRNLDDDVPGVSLECLCTIFTDFNNNNNKEPCDTYLQKDRPQVEFRAQGRLVTSEAKDKCHIYAKLATKPYSDVKLKFVQGKLYNGTKELEIAPNTEAELTTGAYTAQRCGNNFCTTITFGGGDWWKEKELVIEGQDDDNFDGLMFWNLSISTESDDPDYKYFDWQYKMANIDNDIAQLIVQQYKDGKKQQMTGDALPVDETGAQATFWVGLRQDAMEAGGLKENVVIQIAAEPPEAAAIEPKQITFEATRGTQTALDEQEVTVTGKDDGKSLGNREVRVTLSTTSADKDFNVQWYFLMTNYEKDGFSARTETKNTTAIPVTTTHGCDTTEWGDLECKIQVTAAKETWRRGAYDALRIDVTQRVLNTEYSDWRNTEKRYKDYPEKYKSQQDDESTLQPSTLQFEQIEMDGREDVTKEITVIGKDDNIDDDDAYYEITLTGRLTYCRDTDRDPGESCPQADKGQGEPFEIVVIAKNKDDDVAGITTAVTGNVTTEEGACQPRINDSPTVIGGKYGGICMAPTHMTLSDTNCWLHCHSQARTQKQKFRIKLNSEPTHPVVVPITVDDMKFAIERNEAIVYPDRVTFTPQNWLTEQTVTIQGVDDYMYDKNTTYTITVGPAESDDPKYANQHNETFRFVNIDNDYIGLDVKFELDDNNAPLNKTDEAGTYSGSLKARLLSQPTSTVLFTVSTTHPGEASVTPSILSFSVDDWSSAQRATVQGVQDLFRDGDVQYQVKVSTLYTSDKDYSDVTYGMLSGSLTFVNLDEETDRSPDECEMGWYGNALDPANPCRPCRQGTFSDVTQLCTGSESNRTCRAITQASDCKVCPKGTMGVMKGGTSMVKTIRHNELVAAACEACPPGRHQPFTGMSNCIPCTTRGGAVGGSVTLANFGEMWYCPPGTGWGSEPWRSDPQFSQALDHVAYNTSEFVETYKHAWEAPEQEEFLKVLKNPFSNSTFQVTELNLPYFISGVGWVLTIFIFSIIGCTYCCAKHEFISDERWFNLRDWIKRKDYFEDEHSRELQEGGSFLGGMTTVLFMVWAYSLLGLTGFFFIEFNTQVTQALVPKTEAAVKGLRPDIWIVVKFIGYTGPCLPLRGGYEKVQYNEFENADGEMEWETVPQSSLSWQEQGGAKGLVIKPTGLEADASRGGFETFETSCSHVPGEFLARYSCTKCIVTSAAVSFELECDPIRCSSTAVSDEDIAACAACKQHLISAQMISWKLQSSKILPTEENAVAGKIPSLDSSGNFAPHLSFRGQKETMLTISLIPSTYDNLIDGIDGEGYRVQYMKHTAAEGVEAKDFLDGRRNAVIFKMLLETNIVQLELKITPKRSPMEAFAEAGGLFGAVMGLVVVMMNSIEVAQNVWDAITKREDDSESESDSASDEQTSSSDESSSSDSDSESAAEDKDSSDDDSDSDDEEADKTNKGNVGKKKMGDNDAASNVGAESDNNTSSVTSASTAASATGASTENIVKAAKGSSASSESRSKDRRRERRSRQESESSIISSDSRQTPQRKHSRVIDDDESIVSAEESAPSSARKARKGSRMEPEKGRRRQSRYADDDLDSVSSKGSAVSVGSTVSSSSSSAQPRARKSRSGQQRQSRYARR